MPRKRKEDLTREFEHIWGPINSERMRALMIELSSWVRYKEHDEKIEDFIESYNEDSRPFKWVKTSQQILAKAQRPVQTT